MLNYSSASNFVKRVFAELRGLRRELRSLLQLSVKPLKSWRGRSHSMSNSSKGKTNGRHVIKPNGHELKSVTSEQRADDALDDAGARIAKSKRRLENATRRYEERLNGPRA